MIFRKEFMGNSLNLSGVLTKVREEMLKRGYHPKKLELGNIFTSSSSYTPWQTLEQQIEILKAKGCKCNV